MTEQTQTAPRSLFMIAMGHFWRARAARIAVYGLAVVLVLAIYAPLLASPIAIIWWDEQGLRLPIFSALWNRHVYPEAHDLLFNIVALVLPLALVGRWLWRRCSLPRYAGIATALVLGVWVLAQVPLIPSADGWQAVWRKRALPSGTIAQYHQIQQLQDQGVAAVTPGTVLSDEQGRAVRVAFIDRGGEQPRFRVTVLADKRNVWLDGDQLQLPTLYLTWFPLVPHDYRSAYPDAIWLSPGAENTSLGTHFWLGTDGSGRDLFARMLYGARISLTIGLLATGLSMGIGVLIGGISGFFGGRIDIVLQRIVEIMMVFPSFMLVLILIPVVGKNIFNIILIFALTGWAGAARLVRGEYLAQAGRDYVLAARALGLPRWRIMFVHILPNVMTPLLIAAAFGVAGTVLGESGLAFLNLVDPETPSWGLVLNEARQNPSYVHLVWVPGLAIFALVSVLNIIGNRLREAFDPRSSRRG